ncbi:hypothetical protein AgCh_019892 [Apium graveolens]
MSEAKEVTGAVGGTLSMKVDATNPSKELKIRLQLKAGRRAINGERVTALKEEIDRLLEAKLVRESFYPKWVANTVLVRKPNRKWHTCVDFTNLNNAYPKDSFYLPMIDQLVDAMAGHTLISFMDTYSGYNQIPMYKLDEEHTSFITDRDQIGKIMEVYVDDMLVKSMTATDRVAHLSEMFSILRKFWMKLNPQKCVFGVESGKFLGFIVNHRGIEANPAKIKVLIEMCSPRNMKEGYYWPDLQKDCHLYTKSCNCYWRFTNLNSSSDVPLKPLTSPSSFVVWGIDLIGKVAKGKGGVKYAVVVVDYFTTWAKVEPIATIIAAKFKEFIFKAIIDDVSFKRDNYDPSDNELNHRLHLDLVVEVCANVQLKLAAYQQRTRKYLDKKVRARPLRVGDLVLRRMKDLLNLLEKLWCKLGCMDNTPSMYGLYMDLGQIPVVDPREAFKSVRFTIYVMSSALSLRSILDAHKLTGPNFADWLRNLKIVLRVEKLEYVLDSPKPTEPASDAHNDELIVYHKWIDDANVAQCIMLAFMNIELQKQHEHIDAHTILMHLQELYDVAGRTAR